MKKMLFMGIVASAAIAMTGCSSDETVLTPSAQGNAIEFGTYLGRDAQMRGTVMDNTELKNMGVYASYTGRDNYATTATPNFMFNQEVKKSDSGWTYSPVKYWPSTKGDKVSFFACAPFGDANGVKTVSSAGDAGAPSVEVTVQDAANMKDFVAGVLMDKSFNNGENVDNTVKFTLMHEMSRVGISAKLDKEFYSETEDGKKTFVVIRDVQIDKATEGQFYSKAKYTFSTTTDTRGTWDFSNATKSSADLNLAGILDKKSITAANAESGDYKTGVDGIKLTDATVVSLFKSDEYLFLIPVSANDGDGLTSGKATATITYDIVTEDSKLAAGYSVTSATKTVNLPQGTLKQGAAYTYTFVIKLNEVVLSATVGNWDTPETNNDVNVPYDANK